MDEKIMERALEECIVMSNLVKQLKKLEYEFKHIERIGFVEFYDLNKNIKYERVLIEVLTKDYYDKLKNEDLRAHSYPGIDLKLLQ